MYGDMLLLVKSIVKKIILIGKLFGKKFSSPPCTPLFFKNFYYIFYWTDVYFAYSTKISDSVGSLTRTSSIS